MKIRCAAKKAIFTLSAAMLAACALILAELASVGSGGTALPFATLKLAAPDMVAYAETSEASFLNSEAGMAIYTETGETLDLQAAAGAYKTIEAQTSAYIVGSVSLPGLTESDDVHCYVGAGGLIVVYYFASEPAAKIIDWNFYYDGTLASTKLQEGLNLVCNAMGIMPADAHYYDFRYPYATNMMIVLDDDSFTITIPVSFTVYERSWSHKCSSTVKYGSLTASQLSPGTSHLIETKAVSVGMYFCDYYSRIYIDSVITDYITASSSTYNSGKGAIVLLYRDPQ